MRDDQARAGCWQAADLGGWLGVRVEGGNTGAAPTRPPLPAALNPPELDARQAVQQLLLV